MAKPVYKFKSFGYWVDDIFYVTSVHGMCSVLSTTLYALNNSNIEATKINAKFSFLAYKNHNQEDIWNLLFKEPNSKIKIDRKLYCFYPELVHDDFYNVLKNNMEVFSPYIKKYFTPSNIIMGIVDNFITKYDIDLQNTIAVHYRGTDKSPACVRDTSTIKYVTDQLFNIIDKNPEIRVLIQSDEKRITEHFLEVCEKNNIFYIKELPQSINKIGVHIANKYNFRIEYGMNYLSSLILISKCKHIITHYGNGGFWSCLFRGTVDNVLVC